MKENDHQPSTAATNTPALLLKAILGTLTTEEVEQLRVWREADPENERLYQQTLSTEFLAQEFERRQSASYQRPLADMQRRIASGEASPVAPSSSSRQSVQAASTSHRAGHQSSSTHFWLRAAAILAFFLLTGTLAYVYLRDEHVLELAETSQLRPGTMHAFLTLPDGTISELIEPALLPATSTERTETASRSSSTITSKTQTSQPLTLTTPRGGEFLITLEDGTEVWLNAQSRLVYPETFAATERRVQVEGEAYFRVARNEQKPFLVETDGQLIRVLGTEFNVRSYAEDATVQTTLVRGSIALQPSSGSHSSEPVSVSAAQLQLTPGHQAVFDKTAGNINVRSVDTEVVTSWREGRFVFENQTLEQIMLTLSRWYDFTYRFADRHAARTEFMGSIPRYADFTDVITILESSGGLRVSVKDKTVTIESKHN